MRTSQWSEFSAVAALLASAGDPTSSEPVYDRRVRLLSGVAELVQADFWNFVSGVSNHSGDAMLSFSMDGGFRDEHERASFFRISLHPNLASVVQRDIAETLNSGQNIARRRCDMVPDQSWNALEISNHWRDAGFGDFLLMAKPLECGHSAIGLHRRVGRNRFTKSDLELANLIFETVTWLHQDHPNPAAAKETLLLSPRERQVLVFLLEGATRKHIAQSMQLSVHTIVDYLKEIYRKLNVRSQKELIRKFTRGGSDQF